MTDIFYTVCPPDFSPSVAEKQELILCSYHGVKMYALVKGKGYYEISRIISGEPKDFTREDIAPGKIIKM